MPFRPDETASRPQPVALELPVSVNGARTVEGSDKREPFSESTKTVLVFGSGAVIRLSSPVAAGQLLFLTNEKTKKEVVCQVVKSKNYRSMSGYVELEFTEPVVGFWGMRFPSDRVAGQPSSPTATNLPTKPGATPAAPINETPAKVPPVRPGSTPPIFVSPASSTPAAPLEGKPLQVQPQSSDTQPSPTRETKPVVAAVPQGHLPPKDTVVSEPTTLKQNEGPIAPATVATSLASSFLSLISSAETSSAVPPQKSLLESDASRTMPASSNDKEGTSTEEIRRHTERLREQLSALAFAGAPDASPSAVTESRTPESPVTSKVFELAKTETDSKTSLPPAKVVPPAIKSSLDDEQLQIPSWLEPLARNAVAPASTQELIEREKAKHAAELATSPVPPPEPLPVTAPEAAPEVPRDVEPVGIGNLLPLDEDLVALTQPSGGSKKGIWLAAAAVIVALASAGGWYYVQNIQTAQVLVAPVNRSVSPDKNAIAAQPAPAQTATPAAPQPAPVETEPSSKRSQPDVAPSSPSVKPAETAKPIPAVRDNSRNGATTIPAASTEKILKSNAPSAPPAPEPAQPEPKKTSIGEVHLASPMVNRPVKEDASIAAPTISTGEPTSNLGAGLTESTAGQPAPPEAPLPLGGDVKPAKLINSVSPIYPALAKNQHLTGDVQIDALIDATGKVTAMKVISGPALLQRAAMDALHQWKYQPATLDGKAVPMHLTVTLQFRMP